MTPQDKAVADSILFILTHNRDKEELLRETAYLIATVIKRYNHTLNITEFMGACGF